MNGTKVLSFSDIEGALNSKFSETLRRECAGVELLYEEITDKERDQYILEVVEVLLGNTVTIAGEHRRADWEKGWSRELEALKASKDPGLLVPGYHGKHRLVHWMQRLIRPCSPYLDYHIHRIIVDWAIETFLSDVGAIYEFGCGPAYHLLSARRFNPRSRLIGLDWTKVSQEIITRIVDLGIETNISGRNFDFYSPDESFDLAANSGVLTVAALEQVGDRFESFLKYLLEKRPQVCVHLEPIDELMDHANLIDRLSVMYCRKRNYLQGFLTRLRALQTEGKVKIHREQRTYTGSFFIEGHSLVVWSPV